GRVVVLQQSYRAREEEGSGRRIMGLAAALNEGRLPSADQDGWDMPVRSKAEELGFQGAEQLGPGDESQRAAFLKLWLARFLEAMPDLDDRLGFVHQEKSSGFDEETTAKIRVLFEHYEGFRILCATRVSTGGFSRRQRAAGAGTLQVNAFFHRRMSERLGGRPQGEQGSSLIIGEPVLVTRNDYSLRLYNGDSGVVLRVAPFSEGRARQPEPMAVFSRGDGFVAYPLETLRGRLEPAWAVTVHKAQGSEYENVALLLPSVPVRTLTRELLYTAVSRAKSSVVIVGSREILEAGAASPMERASGLEEMLS
ncbi:MAG: ATP-dependent DNA helicase, partial [Myxococcota bacterium]